MAFVNYRQIVSRQQTMKLRLMNAVQIVLFNAFGVMKSIDAEQ